MEDLTCRVQQHTSAKTCRKQIPALHRVLLRMAVWEPGDMNADIGGGKWDLVTDELAKAGVRNIIYDPYNRDASWNEAALKTIQKGLSTATVANVLNVIAEPQIRSGVIQMAVSVSRRAFFSVYEGNRSGRGERTRDGWQENRTLETYLEEISHFGEARIHRNGSFSFILTEK